MKLEKLIILLEIITIENNSLLAKKIMSIKLLNFPSFKMK